MRDLQGKVAVVTGAASGIGRALAEDLAREGMALVLADVEQGALDAAAEAVGEAGADCLAVPTDVSSLQAVQSLAEAAYERFGVVHVLCNNAGVTTGGVPLTALRHADWQWVLGVNLWGVVHGVEAFVPRMLAGGAPGHIVNTASILGQVVLWPNTAPYVTSKFAVVGLSEALRADLAETPVGVSVLCPGMVRTRILESERTRPSAYADVDERADRAAREQAERMRAAMESGIEASEVGRAVATGILENRFWLLTHPDAREVLEARHLELVDAVERASRDRAPAEP